jgi:hypothetical protein
MHIEGVLIKDTGEFLRPECPQPVIKLGVARLCIADRVNNETGERQTGLLEALFVEDIGGDMVPIQELRFWPEGEYTLLDAVQPPVKRKPGRPAKAK